jgi:flagellar hook-length control protein FliK
MGERQSTARIRLSPPELGHVRVDLRLRDSRVDLRVHAERPEARELLAERLHMLRSALEQHGLVTDRLELTDGRSNTGDAATAERGGAAWADASGRHEPRDGTDPHRRSVPNDDPPGEAGAAEPAWGEREPAQDARLDIRI